MPADEITPRVTALLQSLIRATCVNDGSIESGHESRAADILDDLFAGTGVDTRRYEPVPDRASLIARIEGSDPTAPTLVLMGHTDVVPVTPDGWTHDPHGGDLVDGWVWGRGAIDMLNITSSMALATARLAASGWKPRGTLVFLGVADEEAGGTHGAGWLLKNHPDDAMGDYVLTESGGIPFQAPAGPRLWTTVGEKGVGWRRLTVHGTPSHGSRPLGTDNALITAAHVVTRLAEFTPRAVITPAWRAFVEGMGWDADLSDALTDPDRIWEGISELEPSMARTAHACTHLTSAPTVVHGGTKTNVIPDRVEIDVDLRKLPGQDNGDIDQLLRDALGDELMARVDVDIIQDDGPSESPTDTPLWDAMQRATTHMRPGTELLPVLMTGGTDARFYRERKIPAYGFGMFSDAMSVSLWSEMFHGNDERVDQESLRLSTELWEFLARDVLG